MKNIIVLKMDTVNISGDDKGRQNLNNIGGLSIELYGKSEKYYDYLGSNIRHFFRYLQTKSY